MTVLDGVRSRPRWSRPLSKIEFALFAALLALSIVGAAGAVRPQLQSAMDRIAAALAPEKERPCIGLACVAPAAGAPSDTR
jgi:Flp pilus assembly pilin Flp